MIIFKHLFEAEKEAPLPLVPAASKPNVSNSRVKGMDDVGDDILCVNRKGQSMRLGEIRRALEYAMEYLRAASGGLIYKVYQNKNIILVNNDPNCPTMATDGQCIYVNPGFVMNLCYLYSEHPEEDIDSMTSSVNAIAYVLAHEALHIILQHFPQMIRAKAAGHPYNWDKANVATDMEINWFLENVLRDSSQAEDGIVTSLFDSGITKKIGGQWYDSYADAAGLGDKPLGKENFKDWVDIYNVLDDNVLKKMNKPKHRQQMSEKWNRAFVRGYDAYVQELRNRRLVEHFYLKKGITSVR